MAQFIVAALGYYEGTATQTGIAPEDLPDHISSSAVQSTSFKILRDRLSQELQTRQVRALLIIDSLDPRVDTTDVFDLAGGEASLSISGLLKALGAFARDNKNYDVRFALPSERHSQFLELSTNPAKDLVKTAVMQWTATDLISIAAHRLNIFFREHAEYSGHHAVRYAKLNVNRRRDAITLLQSALGQRVMNRLQTEENTISYILRHTQLLPRHLLLYLNSIFSMAHQSGENFEAVTGKSIREGILRVEQLVCHEVFAAFKHKYPKASQLCDACIPELPLRFRFGDLQSVFNW
ncbi:MAG: hypothetical protein NT154_05840, partial [Verrucomicrobia bacterium]|nr:hypothetical protein [Verrucomicrobiota bacterium]